MALLNRKNFNDCRKECLGINMALPPV